MQRRTLLFVSSLALALFGGVRSVPLQKRFSGDATFYDAGLGACGDENSNSELICAMNTAQYDGSCNKVVTITGPKGSVKCTIKDKCPGCAFGCIDMTPTAFNQIADPAQGRVPITWEFGDAPEPEPEPEPEPSPPSPPPPSKSPPVPPPRSDAQQDPDQSDNQPNSQQDDEQDADNGENDNNATDTDSDTTIHSVSYVFISGDFSLINGGELVNGDNPLDDPEEYSNEIVNNLTDVSDSSDDVSDKSGNDDDDDQSGDDQPTRTKEPSATQYY